MDKENYDVDSHESQGIIAGTDRISRDDGRGHPGDVPAAARVQDFRTRRDLYARATFILGLWVGGVLVAVGHHQYYNLLKGHPAIHQSWVLKVGTTLAFLYKALLAAAVSTAIIQMIWRAVGRRAFTFPGLDSLFLVGTSVTGLMSWEVIYKANLVAIFGVALMVLPLAGITPPGTLTVVQTIDPSTEPCLVPSINFNATNNNPLSPTRDLYGVNSTSGTFDSAPEAKRLISLTAFSEITLPAAIPNYITCGANCTFPVSFFAPALKCEKATPSNKTFPFLDGQPSLINTTTNYVAHMDNGDLWLAWIQSVPEDTVDGIPFRNVILGASFSGYRPNGFKAFVSKCVHYNATYNIQMSVGLSQMMVKDISYELHSPYNNSLRTDTATYLAQVEAKIPIPFEQFRAFGLLDTLFSQILDGSIYEGGTVTSSTLHEESNIVDTMLTESWLFHDGNLGFGSLGNHTVQLPAANLDSKVEELYRNISVSMFVRPNFVASNTTSNCTSRRLKNVYNYDAVALWGSYSAGILLSAIAVAVGILCMFQNGIARDTTFTSLAISTRDTRLDEIIAGAPSHAVQKELSRVKMKYDGSFGVK